MAVEVTACVDMGEADGLATLDRGTSMAQGITSAPNTPVAVTVFDCGHPSYRLLPTTCLKTQKNTEGEESGTDRQTEGTDQRSGNHSNLCVKAKKKNRFNSHPTFHFHCSFTAMGDVSEGIPIVV